MDYIVTGPLCWGRGKTEDEARYFARKACPFKNARRKGSKQWHEHIYTVPTGEVVTYWENGSVTGKNVTLIKGCR